MEWLSCPHCAGRHVPAVRDHAIPAIPSPADVRVLTPTALSAAADHHGSQTAARSAGASGPRLGIAPASLAIPLTGVAELPAFPAALHASYFWCAAIRTLPDDPDTVVLCYADRPVAAFPLRWARWLRTLILSCPAVGPHFDETDVAAFAVAWVLSPSPSIPPVPDAFPGDHHRFPSWDFRREWKGNRSALLPAAPGPLAPFHPATSAFEPLSNLQQPPAVNPQFWGGLMPRHPYAGALYNSGIYGTPIYSRTPPTHRSTPRYNLQPDDARALTAILLEERRQGFYLKPPSGTVLRYAPFFGVPKETPGELRFISDLSAFAGSVNSCTTHTHGMFRANLARWSQLLTRLFYLLESAPEEGHVLLWKLDINNAFRQVGIALRDAHKMAHKVGGDDFMHLRLAMGATRACDSMSQFLALVCDYAQSALSISLFSYVDDALGMSRAHRALQDRDAVRSLLEAGGLPISAKKLAAEGEPSTRKVMLGVLVDVTDGTLRLTDKRTTKLVALLDTFLAASSPPSPKQFQRLLGQLDFAATVIPHGKILSRSLRRFAVHKASADPESKGWVPSGHALAPDVRTELLSWRSLLADLNGALSFLPPTPSMAVLHAACDASKHGAGAFIGGRINEYIQFAWTPNERRRSHVAHWEAGILAITAWAWAAHAAGGFLVVFSDSQSAVSAARRLHCDDLRLALLIRFLALVQAHFRCRVIVEHLPGVQNVTPDYLSRHDDAPVWLSSFQKRTVPPSIRPLFGLLRRRSPRLPSQAAALAARVSTLMNATVRQSGSLSTGHLHWIPSDRVPTILLTATTDFWTSLAGSSTTAPPSQQSTSRISSGRSVPTTVSISTSPTVSTPSLDPSSGVGISSRTSANTVSPPPSPSCKPFTRTPPSTLLSEQPPSSHSPVFSGEASTQPPPAPDPRPPTPSADPTSSQAPPAPSSSTFPTPKPTAPTLVVLSSSRPREVRPAPFVSSRRTLMRRRPAQLADWMTTSSASGTVDPCSGRTSPPPSRSTQPALASTPHTSAATACVWAPQNASPTSAPPRRR